jgi:DNA (cytosine-5)-methyltransferase 1
LDEVQQSDGDLAKKLLIALFIYLLRRKHEIDKEIEKLVSAEESISIEKRVMISQIIQALEDHFSIHNASRLPVIAIYSAYQILVEEVERFRGKTLKPLRGHVSPDYYVGLGDIEVVDENGEYFEVVEVKYDKPIDASMIMDVYGKIRKRKVKRYYVLSTAQPYIKIGEEAIVRDLVIRIMTEIGCEIIVNGVISTINYYLRLMQDPSRFLKTYTHNLEEEFKKRSEVTEEHIEDWKKKLNMFFSQTSE